VDWGVRCSSQTIVAAAYLGRENILKSTVTAIFRLKFSPAPELGELECEYAATTTEDSGTDTLRVRGIKNLYSLHLDETSEDVMLSDLGPFEDCL
jgi:hypothetical protein